MKYILIASCFLFMSCKKDNVSTSAVGEIISIESLNEISLGESDTVVVTFGGGTNGCANADRLQTVMVANTITIKAFYNYPTEPQICTQNIPVHVLKYVYKPTAKGTYTYKAFDSDISVTTLVK